jgi:hypothetical protein
MRTRSTRGGPCGWGESSSLGRRGSPGTRTATRCSMPLPTPFWGPLASARLAITSRRMIRPGKQRTAPCFSERPGTLPLVGDTRSEIWTRSSSRNRRRSHPASQQSERGLSRSSASTRLLSVFEARARTASDFPDAAKASPQLQLSSSFRNPKSEIRNPDDHRSSKSEIRNSKSETLMAQVNPKSEIRNPKFP